MSYAQQLETYTPKIVHNLRLKPIQKIQLERPGWIPSYITEDWDTDPYAYQTEEELMPAGGIHGQLLTYITEVLRIHLKKQGLMLLVDVFLLYRNSKNIKNRIGPDLLLMEDCFPPPSAYDLDIKPPPRCVFEITSPESHSKDLHKNVPFYFNLGIETYFVIDAVTPQKKLRVPIELHLWQRTQGKSYQKIEADNAGFFWLPEMNVKIAVQQQSSLVFVDTLTGNVLRDTEQFDNALEESKQRANTEMQRANAAEQRAETAFENGEQKRQLETARKMLAKGYDLAEIVELTGLSSDSFNLVRSAEV